MGKYFANKFKELRLKNDYTQEFIAEKFNMSKSGISYWESGRNEPSIEMIIKLADLFNVSVDELINDEYYSNIEPIGNSFVTIPIYSYVSCGNGLFNDSEIIDYIPLPKSKVSNSKDYFAVIASGNSMIGKGINNKDLVIFSKTNTLNDGDVGCFCINHESAVCKIYRIDNNSKKVILQSANDLYLPITLDPLEDTFRIIGKLAFVLQDRRLQ